MKKTCPAKMRCDKCYWYRPWDMKNTVTGKVNRQTRCSIDVMLELLPQLVGAIDGCQTAANETRNYVINLALGMAKQGIVQPWAALLHDGKPKMEAIDVGRTATPSTPPEKPLIRG